MEAIMVEVNSSAFDICLLTGDESTGIVLTQNVAI